MSWASCRETTRIEDAAYCLLGIFDVNMPLVYGEEDKASIRLQEEITKVTDDQTLFAWVDPDAPDSKECGLLAGSPRLFSESAHFIPCHDLESRKPYSMVSRRLKIEIRLIGNAKKQDSDSVLIYRGVLGFMDSRQTKEMTTTFLKLCSAARNKYWRVRCSSLRSDSYQGILTPIYVPQTEPRYYATGIKRPKDYIISRGVQKGFFTTTLELVGCLYRMKTYTDGHQPGQSNPCSRSVNRYTVIPPQFVCESYATLLAVVLHFTASVMQPRLKPSTGKRSPADVSVLMGVTKDFTFGYTAVVNSRHRSLEELQREFSPQTIGPMTINRPSPAYSEITIEYSVTQRYRPRIRLIHYEVSLELKLTIYVSFFRGWEGAGYRKETGSGVTVTLQRNHGIPKGDISTERSYVTCLLNGIQFDETRLIATTLSKRQKPQFQCVMQEYLIWPHDFHFLSKSKA